MPNAASTGAFGDLTDAPRSRSVIVVDDETGVRDLLTTWLQSAGHTVAAVSSAEDALSRMEQEMAAVALCDIGLPGRDGLWLAERIRRSYPETAVIMATGSQEVAPAVESLRHGVVDYLTKPFDRERLREAVGRGLDWHATARTPAAGGSPSNGM
jgi:two-component system response regulator GlrR